MVGMRLLYFVMVAVLVTGAAMAYKWSAEQEEALERAVSTSASSVERMEREVRIRSAMADVELNGRGWPVTVDPVWFGLRVPENPLAPGDRPWLEVAGESELVESHPRVRLIVDETTASFWYNPALGVVRARVGVNVSDRKALALYNRVNGSRVTSLVAGR